MKVLLTGATGFVGSEILDQLFSAGHHVRVLSRDPDPLNLISYKNLELFHGNIIEASSLSGCMDGVDAVVHIVGVITEVGENTFDRVHRIGTQNLIQEAKKAKVKRFIHMSSLGTRENAKSQYHQSKWAAEEIVRSSGLDWTIFRPSVIYGSGDAFVNLFAGMMRFPNNLFQLFVIPLIEGGENKLQPVPVKDVAACFTAALSKTESIKKTYDLCGPSPLTMKDILITIANVLGLDAVVVRPPFFNCIKSLSCLFIPLVILKGLLIQPKVQLLHIPLCLAGRMAAMMELFMTKPPLNRDQLIMIQEDNVGDPHAAKTDFGINPPSFEDGISTYLTRRA